jgi:hypothetical protein
MVLTLLGGMGLWLFSDVLGQPTGLVFKDEAVQNAIEFDRFYFPIAVLTSQQNVTRKDKTYRMTNMKVTAYQSLPVVFRRF